MKIDFSDERVIGYEHEFQGQDLEHLKAVDPLLLAKIEHDLISSGTSRFDVDDGPDFLLLPILQKLADEYELVFCVNLSGEWRAYSDTDEWGSLGCASCFIADPDFKKRI